MYESIVNFNSVQMGADVEKNFLYIDRAKQ